MAIMKFSKTKDIVMKKIVILAILAITVISCYEPFRTDYNHTTVEFSTATGSSNDSGVLGRTVVKGEGLQLDFGVYLAGVLNNDKEQWVKFELDPSLLSGTSYEMMPKDYYTMSNDSKFIIPRGKHIGAITIKLDSTKFVNDPKAVKAHYALPFRLTETSADSILSKQSTKILTVKYMSHYAGYYNQTGSYKTYDANGNEIHSGEIDNVIHATTLMLDTVRTNGLTNQKGEDYQMDISTNGNDKVSLKYYPNPNPPQVKNVALDASVTTSAVSAWETLDAVNDGKPVTNSGDTPRYGNWPDGTSWQWVQYQLPNTFNISKTKIYWGSDGGGLMPPTDSYIEYHNLNTDQLEKVPNSTFGNQLDQFNSLDFSPPLTTDVIRVNMIGDPNAGSSTAIIEWQVFGLPAPVTPEQASISTVSTTNNENSYDSANSAYTLNYRVDYDNGNYTIVTTKLTWRNRIRDGVNEWRR